MPLRVVAVVEGHGEVAAVPVLLKRIWYQHLGGDYIEVVPWRGHNANLLHPSGDDLRTAVDAACRRLHQTDRDDISLLLLLLIDTDGKEVNCPLTLAPELVRRARDVRSDAATGIACVLANVEFETWFAAAADSLRGHNDLAADLVKPADPEGERRGKGWIKANMSRKYKETTDMASFAARLDIAECEASSRSFRKLVKVLRSLLPAVGPA